MFEQGHSGGDEYLKVLAICLKKAKNRLYKFLKWIRKRDLEKLTEDVIIEFISDYIQDSAKANLFLDLYYEGYWLDQDCNALMRFGFLEQFNAHMNEIEYLLKCSCNSEVISEKFELEEGDEL